MPILELRGCTPEPLGNYLKGLGVFRLIAEQADPQARAWWKNGVLVLHTRWSRDELVSFFLHGIGEEKIPIYCPTPIFAPWGGRPGFYADGNKKAKEQLAKLLSLDENDRRFLPAKRVAETTTKVLNERTAVVTEKRQSVTKRWVNLIKKDKVDQRTPLKAEIASAMRTEWGQEAVDWFDACLSIEETARFGFLYGTGGNEGSADITNNFWEMIEETIGLPNPKTDSTEKLVGSLFGDSRIGGTASTAGQHFPLAAGSANCGQGFEGSASTNPWDFLLMMEGAVLFAGATTKRLSQFGKGKAAFPFMIDHLATDEQSTSAKDEAKQDGKVIRCRAEFWMPLWSSPASLPAIRALLSEGRLQRPSGDRTEHTLHAMEAIKSLGVSRGTDTFHRVALFERRGKGYYLASSLGFHPTSRSSASFVSQLAELDDFGQHVYRNLREGPGIPDRAMRARHRFHSALATLLGRDQYSTIPISEALRGILVAASIIEREVALLKDRSTLLTPSRALDSAWLRSDDDGHEYRLARSIAGITAWGEVSSDGRSVPAVESIRANLLPVARRGDGWAWDDTSHSAVWSRGAPLEVNLAAVLRRRLVDAQKGSGDGLPLWSSYGVGFGDLLAFWHGEVNEDRLTDLIHGLALVDTGTWKQSSIDGRQMRDEPTPDLQTGAVWFDANDEARITLSPVEWHGQRLLTPDNLRAAFELPTVYHLLKLCFVGGRLPHRPVAGRTVPRTGDEPFAPSCLDVLTLLEAGRLADAVQLAARRLRAKGYPPLLRDGDLQALTMTSDQCRRLAGMLLIPVRQPGVCAALAIKPETTC
jgi:CRISPR-associated protein Csx17